MQLNFERFSLDRQQNLQFFIQNFFYLSERTNYMYLPLNAA